MTACIIILVSLTCIIRLLFHSLLLPLHAGARANWAAQTSEGSAPSDLRTKSKSLLSQEEGVTERRRIVLRARVLFTLLVMAALRLPLRSLPQARWTMKWNEGAEKLQ